MLRLIPPITPTMVSIPLARIPITPIPTTLIIPALITLLVTSMRRRRSLRIRSFVPLLIRRGERATAFRRKPRGRRRRMAIRSLRVVVRGRATGVPAGIRLTAGVGIETALLGEQGHRTARRMAM